MSDPKTKSPLPKLIFWATLLLVFSAWSVWICIDNGYWGFLSVLKAGGWQSQVFVDLMLGLTLTLGFVKGDSYKHDIPFWPYLVATPFLGSISPMAYMVHRQIKRLRQGDPVPETQE
jgi:hypothetical protein